MSVSAPTRGRRAYRPLWPGCGPCATEDAARKKARAAANQSGCHIDIWDAEHRRYIKVRPRQHRCQNPECQAPLTRDEYDAHYKTFRCPHCRKAETICSGCDGTRSVRSEAWEKDFDLFLARSTQQYPQASHTAHYRYFESNHGPEWVPCPDCQPEGAPNV